MRPNPGPRLAAAVLLLVAAGLPATAGSVSYREVLRAQAHGSQQAAVEQLYTSHKSQLCTPEGSAGWVRHAEHLAAGRPQVLVPIIDLHVRLHAFELHYQLISGDPLLGRLVADSEEVLEQLTGRYLLLMGAQDPAGIGLVSKIWTQVAESYRREGRLDQAATLFSRAAEIDPGNVAALLAYGVIHERQARDTQAGDAFVRVLQVAPDHDEARLRLALVCSRQGKTELATVLLAEVAESDGPRWVRRLACEELAYLLDRCGHHQQATVAARRAVQLFPDDWQLRTRLFFLFDYVPEMTATMLDDSVRLAHNPTSPWTHNRRWPDDIALLLDDVGNQVQQQAPLLAEALEVPGPAVSPLSPAADRDATAQAVVLAVDAGTTAMGFGAPAPL